METITQFSVFHKIPWGIEVVLYFFFIGMSSGAFFLSILPSVFGKKDYERLSKTSWIVSFIFLIVSIPLLIADLTQPSRFLNLLNPAYLHLSTAPLAWGTVFLTAFGVLSLFYGRRLLNKDSGKNVKTLGALGGFFALTLPVYTGFDIALNQRMPLAHSGLTPVIFTALAISSGIGIVFIVTYIIGIAGGPKFRREELMGIKEILLLCVSAIFLMAVSQSLVLLYGGAYEETTFHIISTEMHGLYWVFGFALGTVLPLIILLIPKFGNSAGGIAIASVLLIIASYSYRFVMVFASQLIQLYLT